MAGGFPSRTKCLIIVFLQVVNLPGAYQPSPVAFGLLCSCLPPRVSAFGLLLRPRLHAGMRLCSCGKEKRPKGLCSLCPCSVLTPDSYGISLNTTPNPLAPPTYVVL